RHRRLRGVRARARRLDLVRVEHAAPVAQRRQRRRACDLGRARALPLEPPGRPRPGCRRALEMVDVTMPRLSDSMEEGTIVEWLKAPGDRVARGEPLVEVETDKATIVYEAEEDGVLAELVVAAGGSAPLGAVIARIAVEATPGAVPERRAPV